MILSPTSVMESIYSFEDGPYDVMSYSVVQKDGKFYVEVNRGDLGRLPLESAEAVQQLRQALDLVEEEMKEMERRKEEL